MKLHGFSCHKFVELKKKFFTKILTQAILDGELCCFFGKDEYFYKFTTLHFWHIKNKLWKILLRIQKFGQKWSTIAYKHLNVVKCHTRAQCYKKEYNATNKNAT